MSLDKSVEVDWPEKSGYYKVVQLVLDDCLTVIFGPEILYHKDILASFLRQKNIEFNTNKGLPEPKGDCYEAVGMGQAIIKKPKAGFFGDSTDYELGINHEHLDRVKETEIGWEIEY